MNALVRAAFAISCGALLLAHNRRVQTRAILAAALFGTAMLLQLTRSAYFGAATGFVLGGTIWWFRRHPYQGTARRRLLVIPVVLVCLLALGAALFSFERHLLSLVGERIGLAFTDLNSQGGTVGVRANVSGRMIGLLGGEWPIGLGFLHPTAVHFFGFLPNGSIRNPDTGVLNVLMTMGAVGTVLLYLPLLVVLFRLARSSRVVETRQIEWFRLGLTVWIVGVVVSSITLVDLFSFGGLELTACLLALAVAASAERGPELARAKTRSANRSWPATAAPRVAPHRLT
jgi:hypothetical protein